jgi:hypothetical protein
MSKAIRSCSRRIPDSFGISPLTPLFGAISLHCGNRAWRGNAGFFVSNDLGDLITVEPHDESELGRAVEADRLFCAEGDFRDALVHVQGFGALVQVLELHFVIAIEADEF